MRIALFVTCLADTLFPASGRPPSSCWSGSGTRSTSRGSRPAAARCTSTPATSRGAAAGAPLRRDVRAATTPWSRRRGRASGRCATSTRWWPAEPATRPCRRARRVAPRTYELSEFLVDVLGRRPTSARTSRTGSPTTRPATRCAMLRVGDKPLRLLRDVRGHRPGRAARRRPVLRLRRHVRDEERRHVDGDARRQDAPRPSSTGAEVLVAGDNSCLMHIGGVLAPAALGRPDDAPGRDPGLDRSA